MSSPRVWLPLTLALVLVAGLAVAVPPLVLRAFVAAQRRIGNGAHPAVARVARNAAPIARGVWIVWALGALVGLPPLFREAAREHSATSGVSASGVSASGVSVPADAVADVTVPAPDTPPRDAILDAVRARLGLTSRLSVDHIAMAATDGVYAFVRATEVVAVEGAAGDAQESDLTVMALLELPPGGAERTWRVAELWTLPDDGAHPQREFVRRVRARQAAAHLPAALFPSDL